MALTTRRKWTLGGAAAVADMRSGGLAAATFAAVSDSQVLGLQGEGLASVRDFQPGEAWQSYRRQIGNLKKLEQRGLVYPVRQVDRQQTHAFAGGGAGGVRRIVVAATSCSWLVHAKYRAHNAPNAVTHLPQRRQENPYDTMPHCHRRRLPEVPGLFHLPVERRYRRSEGS